MCAVSWATWLLFTCLPARWVVSRVRCPGPLGSCSPVCWLGVLCRVCGVLGHLAPVPLCARSVGRVACAVSWASYSPVCWLGALCCVCGVLGHLAPVHRCASPVHCVAHSVSLATWLLSSGVLARYFVLCVPRPGPLGSCSPVCLPGVLCRVCGVLGHLAPVQRCSRPLRCVACAMSWAFWLLFTRVLGRCFAWRVCSVLGLLAPVHRCARSVRCFACVQCPWPLGSCSPVCLLHVLCCVCVVLGQLAPVHRCACSVKFAACSVSWDTWLLFTGVPGWCVVLRVRCPGPLGSCSPLDVFYCVVLRVWVFAAGRALVHRDGGFS